MVKAVAVLSGSEGVKGTIFFTQEGEGPTTVTGSVNGLKQGLHGFHVHALGDTTNGCMSTGAMSTKAMVTGPCRKIECSKAEEKAVKSLICPPRKRKRSLWSVHCIEGIPDAQDGSFVVQDGKNQFPDIKRCSRPKKLGSLKLGKANSS